PPEASRGPQELRRAAAISRLGAVLPFLRDHAQGRPLRDAEGHSLGPAAPPAARHARDSRNGCAADRRRGGGTREPSASSRAVPEGAPGGHAGSAKTASVVD